jgi:hypothetical protein
VIAYDFRQSESDSLEILLMSDAKLFNYVFSVALMVNPARTYRLRLIRLG